MLDWRCRGGHFLWMALTLGTGTELVGCSSDSGGEDPVASDDGVVIDTGEAAGDDATDSDGSGGDSGGTTGDGVNLDAGLGGGTDGDNGTEGGPDTCIEDVDVVFVMDVSTTMGGFFDVLEAEIETVHQAVTQLDLISEPHYGLVVFVDDFTLENAGAPYTDVTELQAKFEEWNTRTSTNSQTNGSGSNSTFPENSLDAIYAGASGFQWRPSASTLRLIIHTTDDTFWDRDVNATGNGVTIQRNYGDVVSALQDNEIRFFTFAATIGGSTGTTDVSPGWSADYMGQPPIKDVTDGDWFDIDQVLAGSVSLADAIEGAVIDNRCEEFPPVG